MKKSVLVLFFVAATVRGDLQFNPQTGVYDLDGIKFERLVFYDGPAKITYSPPVGWHYTGESNKLVLWPPRVTEAEASVTVRKAGEFPSFDADGIKRLTDEAVASLPSGATRINIVSQATDPVVIERKGTYLCVMEYERGGVLWSRSVLFLNRKPGEQIQFQLTCKHGDFAALERAFQASHFTWQNL